MSTRRMRSLLHKMVKAEAKLAHHFVGTLKVDFTQIKWEVNPIFFTAICSMHLHSSIKTLWLIVFVEWVKQQNAPILVISGVGRFATFSELKLKTSQLTGFLKLSHDWSLPEPRETDVIFRQLHRAIWEAPRRTKTGRFSTQLLVHKGNINQNPMFTQDWRELE